MDVNHIGPVRRQRCPACYARMVLDHELGIWLCSNRDKPGHDKSPSDKTDAD